MEKKKKFEVVTAINEIVIQGLTERGLNWFQPWRDDLGNIADPIRWSDGNPYRGTNKFMLNWYMELFGHSFNQWLTYNQAAAQGGKPQKGKARMVIYWSKKFVVKKEGQKDKWFDKYDLAVAYKKKIGGSLSPSMMTKYFNVWNIEDVVGLEPKVFEKRNRSFEKLEFKPNERAQFVLDEWNDKPKMRTGSKAYYMPSLDQITMPAEESFCDSDSYYKVLFHECIHSTGHESRLNRPTIADKGSTDTKKKEYSREELIAEIGAMYLTGLCDLIPKDDTIQSQAYINGWITHLTDHKHEATSAMQRAEKAIDYILESNTNREPSH